MMKRAALCLFVLSASAASGQTTPTAPTITIGTEADFPPMIFRDEAGNLIGRDKDIGDQMCARAGWDCEWVVTDFDALISGVADGAFDIAIASIGATPERAEIVDFSAIYRPRSKNSANFAGLGSAIDLATARISVPTGTIMQAHLDTMGLKSLPYPSNTAALNALLDGKVDLLFTNTDFLRQMVEQGFDMLIDNGQVEIASFGPAVAVAKGRDALVAELDAIIADMWADGTLDLLHAKWVGDNTDA